MIDATYSPKIQIQINTNTNKSPTNNTPPDHKQEKSVSGNQISKRISSDISDHEIEIESVTAQEQIIIDNYADKPQLALSTKPKKSNLLADYSEYSSIHGVRYFSDSQRHWSERLWWLITFSTTVFICGYLIISTYIKWQENPVIISFGDAPSPVWEFPFPAITVCPNSKIQNLTQLNYTERIGCMSNRNCIWSKAEFILMKAAVQVCHNIALLDGYGDAAKNVTQVIRMLAPNKAQVFKTCEFNADNNECGNLFHETLTDKGLCFTFNMPNSGEFFTDKISEDHKQRLDHKNLLRNWNPETMAYSQTESSFNKSEFYPRRVIGIADVNKRNIMEIKLRLSVASIDKQCAGPLQGYRILLHAPDQYPNMVKNYLTIGTKSDYTILVKPKMINASPDIAAYHADQRQCYFNGERKLRFFKFYNQNNCELECLSEYTVRRFKCVAFYMPRNQSTSICNQEQLEKVKIVVSSFFDGFLAFQFRRNCDCLPACNFITYESDMKVTKDQNLSDIRSLYTVVRISYAENEFITKKRSEQSGKLEFLAACGGFLGLFMGISLLSIAELVYFFSLRLLCNVFAVDVEKPVQVPSI